MSKRLRRASASTTMPLVPPHNQGNVRVPDLPQAVPTIDDITNARRYIANLTECKNLSSRPQIATAEDITRAEIYKHKYEVVRDEIRRAMEELRREMRQSMEVHRREMRQSMEEHRREVRQSVVAATNPVLIVSTRAYNTGCGTGAHRQYDILPFIIEGELVNPDAIKPPLPLLTSFDVIDGLNDNDLDRYLWQYGIRFHHNHRRTIKLQRLKEHLGVVVNESGCKIAQVTRCGDY
ncbi:hypothetical protein M378DRAFT_24137 [Amanita muscaria Koide BX008]|uniref:Mug135-like C-terminal domain-containing protein n=1 Tax=Amanita muscaria (strain Koide BX008) TaxID=946122 RepID=A0A0C2X994_AMAMK|nr:hypothetical protein M378DRAFT_24137 [Amanita muscaria Koide BX008]